jgi:hypothetical protein
MPTPIRITAQGKMQQYRLISYLRGGVADGPGLPTADQRAFYLFDCTRHDGAQFRVDFAHDGTNAGAAFQIDVLFYDAELDAWTEDVDQRMTGSSSTSRVFEFDVLTRRRPVYLRVTTLTGNQVVLDIKAAVFMCSKV